MLPQLASLDLTPASIHAGEHTVTKSPAPTTRSPASFTDEPESSFFTDPGTYVLVSILVVAAACGVSLEFYTDLPFYYCLLVALGIGAALFIGLCGLLYWAMSLDDPLADCDDIFKE